MSPLSQTSLRQLWGSSATWPSSSSVCPTRLSVPSSPLSSPLFQNSLSHSLVSLPQMPASTRVSVAVKALLQTQVYFQSFCESVHSVSPVGCHQTRVGACDDRFSATCLLAAAAVAETLCFLFSIWQMINCKWMAVVGCQKMDLLVKELV